MAKTLAAPQPITAEPRRAPFLSPLMRHRSLTVELTLLAGFLLMALFGPLLITADPTIQDLARIREAPNPTAWFGRDEVGRDILARVVVGSRYTLLIGAVTVFLGLTIGLILGLLAGYVGSWVDAVIMRVMDMFLVFPSILLALVMISILGVGLINVVLAVTIYNIPIFARLVRGQTLRLREEQFIESARAIGVPDAQIVRRHILPNMLSPLLVQTTYAFGEAIIFVTGLGFLGLGIQPPTPEWGAMLNRGREVMFVSPHVVLIPGTALVILLLVINLLGDSLRDLLDPRQRA
jgi:peptide/nickel transport system permease protein